MKKHEIMDSMTPESIKKFEANMKMIEKVKGMTVAKHGYNLNQRPVFNRESLTPPKTGVLGIIARED